MKLREKTANHIQGLFLGFAAGVIDCGIYMQSGEAVTGFDIATALTFWTAIGWLIHITQLPFPHIIKGIAISIILNIPWGINFTAQGMAAEVLPFMIVFSTIFGALLGYLSSKPMMKRYV